VRSTASESHPPACAGAERLEPLPLGLSAVPPLAAHNSLGCLCPPPRRPDHQRMGFEIDDSKLLLLSGLATTTVSTEQEFDCGGATAPLLPLAHCEAAAIHSDQHIPLLQPVCLTCPAMQYAMHASFAPKSLNETYMNPVRAAAIPLQRLPAGLSSSCPQDVPLMLPTPP